MLGRRKRKYTRRQPEAASPLIDHWQLPSETKRTIVIIVLFTLALLGIVSLFNGAGTLGVWLNIGLSRMFGWANWIALLLLLAWDFLLIFSGRFGLKKINYLGLCFLFISLVGLFDYFELQHDATSIADLGIGGGYLGYFIGHNLAHVAGFWGGLIILLGLLVTGVIIFLNASFEQIFHQLSSFRLSPNAATSEELFETSEEEFEQPETLLETSEQPVSEVEEEIIDESRPRSKPEAPATFYRPIKKVEIPLDLLNAASSKPTSGDIKANSLKIQKALETFGIGVSMDDVNIGPTVTQYTLKPDDGVKLSQITTLQNDIALALAAHPIRIEAPIPGKSLIGIEVPNQTVAIVRLREVLSSEAFHNRKSNLMIALGKDVSGKSNMADLAKMPHLLIAGATGSGKSVSINSVIISLLWQNSPSDLKLILVDPKRVELSLYQDIPHLLTPIITDAKSTINALRWVVTEMDKRYEILAAAGKRNIESYNAVNTEQRMPYLVIVVDEFNTLMSVAPKEVEGAIVRLAQMARAVGIHLILATQRPSVNVITGLIKANITSRIAFSVASQADSRTILDMSGAEKLLGNGDLLFISAELSKPRRIQGAYVSEKEVKAVGDFLRQTGEPEYNAEITSVASHTSSNSGNFDAADDEQEIREAAELVIRTNAGSATMLQSRMRVGYAKAARLLNTLEDLGIVGSAQGSKAREVMIEAEQLDYYLSGAARNGAAESDTKNENTNEDQSPEFFE